jgi:hypothetical protein
MKFGLKPLLHLHESDRIAVESYFGCDIATLTNSCLIVRTPSDDVASVSAPVRKLDFALDLLESLWYTQAMKERHFDAWISDLRKMHSNEVKYS